MGKLATLRRFVAATTSGLLLLAVSEGAFATYGDWDVSSDAGTYSPIVLGDTIALDACGSTYFNYYNQSQSYSICSLSNLSSFTLTWKAKIGNTWAYISDTFSGNNTVNGLQINVATGAGTFFSEVGTYRIGLYLTVNNNSNVPLPNGSYGYSNDYGGYDPGNNRLDWSNSFAASAAPDPVPEPAMALLLLPGLFLIARRDRKQLSQKIA